MRYLWLLLLLIPSYSLADSVIGTMWKQEGTTVYPADDVVNISYGNVTSMSNPAWTVTGDGIIMNRAAASSSIDSTWSSQVGRITGITGIHLHEIGADSCHVTRNTDITKFDVNACIIHIKGIEYRFSQITAISPNFAAGESRVFVGYSSTQLVQQDTAFTDDQRGRIIPLARIQAAKGQLGPGSDISNLGITDLRPITENFEKTLLLWVKNFNGPLVKTGLEVSESVTTDRQIDIAAGTFSDEELVSHTAGPFASITGLVLFHTALGNWTSILDVIKPDNINYDTATGLVPMTNNNWYRADNLMASPEGNGRKPRFILVISQAQYNDIGDAELARFDFGPFTNSTPRMVPLAKVIVKKNTARYVGIQDARPLNASGVGVGSNIGISLQGAYNNSPNSGIPEITTNGQHDDLTIRHGGAGVSPLILSTQLESALVTFGSYTTHVDVVFSNGSSVQFDDDTTAGNTRFLLYDVDNGQLERVSVGAADSGGAGFKVLRIPN